MPRIGTIAPMDTKTPCKTTQEKRNDRRSVVRLLLTLALVSAFGPAWAESSNVLSSTTRAATAAHLDFRIVIPKVLQLDASTGTLFTNAHQMETIVIATADADGHRSISSRSNGKLFRGAIDTLTREAGHALSGYTVAMP
jgi:hypothetical protein